MSSDTPRTATNDWKWRRREAIIRDDYACQECGAQGGRKGDTQLHVHHIKPVAEGGSDDLENLETLCSSCHRSTHAENQGSNAGHFEQKYFEDEFLAALEKEGWLAGTQDVADAVGCSYELAYKRLRALADAGDVESQKVANARVWSVTEDAEGRSAKASDE